MFHQSWRWIVRCMLNSFLGFFNDVVDLFHLPRISTVLCSDGSVLYEIFEPFDSVAQSPRAHAFESARPRDWLGWGHLYCLYDPWWRCHVGVSLDGMNHRVWSVNSLEVIGDRGQAVCSGLQIFEGVFWYLSRHDRKPLTWFVSDCRRATWSNISHWRRSRARSGGKRNRRHTRFREAVAVSH
jgi:hypothetical protein